MSKDITNRMDAWLVEHKEPSVAADIMHDGIYEIERLREALKEIDALPHQKRGSVSYAMAAIARSALQQKDTE